MNRKETPDILGDILSATPPAAVSLRLNQIMAGGGTQMRAKLNDETVDEYAELFAAAGGWGTFPPIVVYYDGAQHWLADGFHRVAALRKLTRDEDPMQTRTLVQADVRAGTRRDAILFAAGANASHGLRRTTADRKRAVETLLRDDEWRQWSNSEIARRCNVDDKTVAAARSAMAITSEFRSDNENVKLPAERQYTDRWGNERTMNTANIGKRPEPADEERPATRVLHAETPAATHEPMDETDLTDSLPDALRDAGWRQFRTRKKGYRAEHDDLGVFEMAHPLTLQEEMQKRLADAPAVTAEAAVPVSQRDGYDGDEWYTPLWLVKLVRDVMGDIDLDPASCEMAQTVIRADGYLTRFDDGLKYPWSGRVFLNPPYSKPDEFIAKLQAEVRTGRTKAAIVLVNNATETTWFQALLREWKVCLLNRRLAFWRHDHAEVGARQGQAVFYFGPNPELFAQVFGPYGIVLQRVRP